MGKQSSRLSNRTRSASDTIKRNVSFILPTKNEKKDATITPKESKLEQQIERKIPMVDVLYRQGKVLGSGHFAQVKQCTRISDNEQFAMKIIQKNEMADEDVIRKEVEILKTVGEHKNIVSLVDVQEDSKCFYLIMELCPGGDLFEKIVEEGNYSEQQAQKTCFELASALIHIHSKGITHRDLKPENILLDSSSEDAVVKVADFGLSKLMDPNQLMMKTVCGTWAYCAPEVLNKKPYTKEVDCWTLGVLMYILLSGYHPFDVYGDLNEPDLMDMIMDNEWNFNDQIWDTISQDAKNLIVSLLQLDPKERITLEEYINSPWITGKINHKRNSLVAKRLAVYNKLRFKDVVYAQIAVQKMTAKDESKVEIQKKENQCG